MATVGEVRGGDSRRRRSRSWAEGSREAMIERMRRSGTVPVRERVRKSEREGLRQRRLKVREEK